MHDEKLSMSFDYDENQIYLLPCPIYNNIKCEYAKNTSKNMFLRISCTKLSECEKVKNDT